MDLRYLAASTLVFAGLISGATAQNGKRNPASAALAETHQPSLTGKERLGPKWTDEQRIDNCHVPIDKRGNKPRPNVCPNSPSS